jgi:hypothetical protein
VLGSPISAITGISDVAMCSTLSWLINALLRAPKTADSAAASQPKLVCVRRAMDPLHQARVLIEVGPVWWSLTATHGN